MRPAPVPAGCRTAHYGVGKERNHDAGGVGRGALPHPGPDGRHPPGGLQGGEGAYGPGGGPDRHLQPERRSGLRRHSGPRLHPQRHPPSHPHPRRAA